MIENAKSSLIDPRVAQRRSETLKALGHPVRLSIVELLDRQEHNVGELAAELSLDSAIVSQQLKILRLSGLVHAERRDGRSFYRLSIPQLSRLLDCLRSCDH